MARKEPSARDVNNGNHRARVVLWATPRGKGGASMVAVTSPTQGGDEELPKGWKEIFDEATGAKYYFNGQTGETKWTKPTAD